MSEFKFFIHPDTYAEMERRGMDMNYCWTGELPPFASLPVRAQATSAGVKAVLQRLEWLEQQLQSRGFLI